MLFCSGVIAGVVVLLTWLEEVVACSSVVLAEGLVVLLRGGEVLSFPSVVAGRVEALMLWAE